MTLMKGPNAMLPQTTLENAFLFRNFRTPIHISRYRRGHFPMHFHDFLEIMVVNASTGRQEINRKLYELERGQVFFLSHFHAHEIFKTDAHNLDYYNICFQPEALHMSGGDSELAVLKPFFDPAGVRPLTLDESGYTHIATFCAMACREIEGAEKNVVSIVINLLNTILSYLGRYTSFNVTDAKELTVLKAMSRINADFASDLTTKGLASELGLSAARLSQIFRERTGRTVKDMLVERRLIEAKRTLAGTQTPITRIILDSGFNDMAYFHRAFRKDTGMTPGQYRAKSSLH
jgi:AraC family transcriptional activator of pobA